MPPRVPIPAAKKTRQALTLLAPEATIRSGPYPSVARISSGVSGRSAVSVSFSPVM